MGCLKDNSKTFTKHSAILQLECALKDAVYYIHRCLVALSDSGCLDRESEHSCLQLTTKTSLVVCSGQIATTIENQ